MIMIMIMTKKCYGNDFQTSVAFANAASFGSVSSASLGTDLIACWQL